MTDLPSAVPVAITGVGLRTSVGANALQTTTSVRARLNRFREWPHLGLDLGADSEGLPSASAIEGMGDATWQEKAADLATPAVEEALHAARLFGANDLAQAYGREALALYLAAPYPVIEGEPDHEDAVDAIEDAVTDFVHGLDSLPAVVDAVGHAAGIRCLAAAMRDLHEQRIDVAIVGGIDSLLETESLVKQISEGRIKLEDTAGGVIPGEGAAFLVLERCADVANRGVESVARLGNIALAHEPISYDGTEPLEATGLTDALQGILDHCDPEAIGLRDVFVDLNGERGRFQEWALAEGRSLHRLPYGWELHYPALSLGELGAASGVAMVGVVAKTYQLGRAGGETALVCSSSERGERACALIGAPIEAVQ